MKSLTEIMNRALEHFSRQYFTRYFKTLTCFLLWFTFCSPFLFQGHTKTEWRTCFPYSGTSSANSACFLFKTSFFEYKLELVQGKANRLRREIWGILNRMIMNIIFSDHLRVSCGDDVLSAHLKCLGRWLRKQ